MGTKLDFLELNTKSLKEAITEAHRLTEARAFAEASGWALIEATDLKTSQDAYNFLIDHCVKLGPALIVEVNGKYYMGAWCSRTAIPYVYTRNKEVKLASCQAIRSGDMIEVSGAKLMTFDPVAARDLAVALNRLSTCILEDREFTKEKEELK